MIDDETPVQHVLRTGHLVSLIRASSETGVATAYCSDCACVWTLAP